MIYQCEICLKVYETLKERKVCKKCQHEVDKATVEMLSDEQFEKWFDKSFDKWYKENT